MTQTQVQHESGLTPQMRQAIGVGVLILCLLVGGGIIYWFMFGSAPSTAEVSINPNAPVRMQGRRMPTPRVISTASNTWSINGDAGAMRVTHGADGDHFAYGFQRGVLGLNQQQINLVSGRSRILVDPPMAKAWKITPEQMTKLKAIDFGSSAASIPMTSAEQAEITKLWKDFQDASDKGASQKALVDRLDAIARGHVDASKKKLVDRIDQISQILTPDQVQMITK